MNCPSCRRGLPVGPHDRCPFCGARLSGPVDGALAAEPLPTPDPRDPIREIPGLRKRERERSLISVGRGSVNGVAPEMD